MTNSSIGRVGDGILDRVQGHRWLVVGAALWGASGCTAEERAVPPIPDDTRAVIWATRSGGSWALQASDLEPGAAWRFSTRLGIDTEVAVLAYDEPLFNLGMAAGPVEASVGVGARPLPQPDAVLGTTFEVGALSWRMLADVPNSLKAFRIPPFRIDACANAGGCYRATSEQPRCDRPCPRSSVDPPVPPAAPVIACPDGWQAVKMACEPPAIGANCLAGTFQPAAASACRDIGRPCGQRFPSLPAGVVDARYVDINAPSGGDGTEAAPFSSISAAMASAPAPAPDAVTILVAAGEYAGPVFAQGAVTVIGVCATRVRLGLGYRATVHRRQPSRRRRCGDRHTG